VKKYFRTMPTKPAHRRLQAAVSWARAIAPKCSSYACRPCGGSLRQQLLAWAFS